MIKNSAIFTLILILISVSFLGCSTAPADQSAAVTISNGTETITPYMLFRYATEYVDSTGYWLASDGVGNFQFEIADYVEEMPSLQATDKMSVKTNKSTKVSEAIFYNSDFNQIVNVTLEKATELDPGTYYLRLTSDRSGRTVGGQTEHWLDYAFVKIIVGAQND